MRFETTMGRRYVFDVILRNEVTKDLLYDEKQIPRYARNDG